MRWLVLIGLLLPASGADAGDGIQRCIDPQGVSIYTDQQCAVFGAKGRVAVATPEPASIEPGAVRSDCARQPDTLLFDLRRAIESDDINQAAGLYHWPGIRGRGAVGVMDRLERLISRPLASAELVYPESAPVHENPEAFPAGTPSEDPVAVRIEQTLPGEIVPSDAETLRLVQHAECWWLQF